MDIEKATQLIRNLLKAFAADKETVEKIKSMSDEEILNYADLMLDQADKENQEFLDELEEK